MCRIILYTFYLLFLFYDVLFLIFCICLLAYVIMWMLIWCRISCVDVDPPVEFEEQTPLEGLEVQEDLTYTEHPVKILDTSERNTRNKKIKMCRVQWSHHTETEATWKREDELKAHTPLS